MPDQCSASRPSPLESRLAKASRSASLDLLRAIEAFGYRELTGTTWRPSQQGRRALGHSIKEHRGEKSAYLKLGIAVEYRNCAKPTT